MNRGSSTEVGAVDRHFRAAGRRAGRRGDRSDARGWVLVGADVAVAGARHAAGVSRRAADLPGIDLPASRAQLANPLDCAPDEGSLPTFSGWKRLAKRYAAEKLAAVGLEESWHDAGYDAAAAILQVGFFTSLAIP